MIEMFILSSELDNERKIRTIIEDDHKIYIYSLYKLYSGSIVCGEAMIQKSLYYFKIADAHLWWWSGMTNYNSCGCCLHHTNNRERFLIYDAVERERFFNYLKHILDIGKDG